MNILILINSFNLGGAEKLSFDLAQKLKQYKDTNVFICSMGGVENIIGNKLIQSFDNIGIPCITLNKPQKAGRIKVLLSLKKVIKNNKIDIVHTNGQSPDFYSRILKIFMPKIKILVTIHSTKGYSRKIEKLQSRLTDQYIAVSKEAKEYAENELKIQRSIKVINNGIDVAYYSQIKTNPDLFTILSVGRLASQKGYLKAIQEAAPFLKAHPDVKWYIYGDYKEHKDYLQKVKELSKSLGIEKAINLMGVSTEPEQIYKNINCFLLASEYEGFGIAYIEAMAVGLPILGRCVGVMNSIKKAGGKFYDIDQENISDILEKLYSGQIMESETIENNRNIIKKYYDMQIVAQKYHDIYLSMMEKQL